MFACQVHILSLLEMRQLRFLPPSLAQPATLLSSPQRCLSETFFKAYLEACVLHSLTHTRAIQQFSVNTNAKKKRKNETKLRRNQLTCALEMPVALVHVLLFLSSLLVSMHACACACACVWDKYGTQGCSRHEQKQTFQLASVCRAPFVYKFNLSKAKTLTAQLNIFLSLSLFLPSQIWLIFCISCGA